MTESYDDFRLLTECISGKQAAWDCFVERYSRLVHYAIGKTLRSRSRYLQEEDVADIHNSIFLSFIEHNYKKLKQFEGKNGCTLSSWVRLISIRQALDFLKGQRPHLSLDDERDGAGALIHSIPDKNLSVEDEMDAMDRRTILKRAIDALSAEDRLFMRLYYEKEFSAKEIADMMQTSVNTIYSKKNRIREKLKKIVENKGLFARKTR